MKFRSDKPIFLQIIEHFEERVLSGDLQAGERIPAVRDFAVEVEVNPNTVVRSFNELEQSGVIYKKRGLGYFLEDNAREKILARHRLHFMTEELPEFLKKLQRLEIDPNEIVKKFNSITDRKAK
jgi:DNA-binding transcriptional regulator YhcF (GntR family)